MTGPFAEYVALLLKLHALQLAGRGGSYEADSVRDEMDIPWRKLTPEQSALARQVSIELYKDEENCAHRIEEKA